MEARLTQFIADLDAGSYPNEKFWKRFRRVVYARARKKGLFSLPPRYVGYDGRKPSHWREPGDAFHDLVADCYQFAILDRLPRLREHLKVRSNIDGLIICNIDHFLIERNRRHDRVSYAVYKNLEGGVLLAVDAGRLVPLHPPESPPRRRVRPSSCFAFAGASDQQRASFEMLNAVVKSSVEFRSQIGRLTQLGRQAQDIVLAGLDELHTQGIQAFIFRELVRVVQGNVKDDIPGRVDLPQTLVLDEESDSDEELKSDEELNSDEEPKSDDVSHIFSRTNSVVQRYEDDEENERWLSRVREALERKSVRSRRFQRILEFYDRIREMSQTGDDFPTSDAEIARRLGLSKSTCSDYCKAIRQVAADLLDDYRG